MGPSLLARDAPPYADLNNHRSVNRSPEIRDEAIRLDVVCTCDQSVCSVTGWHASCQL